MQKSFPRLSTQHHALSERKWHAAQEEKRVYPGKSTCPRACLAFVPENLAKFKPVIRREDVLCVMLPVIPRTWATGEK